MWHLGTQLRGGLGSAGEEARFDNLGGLFQPKQFPSSKFLLWVNETLLELQDAASVSQPAPGIRVGGWIVLRTGKFHSN